MSTSGLVLHYITSPDIQVLKGNMTAVTVFCYIHEVIIPEMS